jgi:putative ABC transport system permease protein
MMSAHRSGNRAMFWRIIRRLLGANRGRLFVILLALGAGAAVTAALLNLQVDAKRRITTEFRAFGPNVLITPFDVTQGSARESTLPMALMDRIPLEPQGGHVAISPFLYFTGAVYLSSKAQQRPFQIPVVIVGTDLSQLRQFGAGWQWKKTLQLEGSGHPCVLGTKLYAKAMSGKWDYVVPGRSSQSPYSPSFITGFDAIPCTEITEFSSGGPEDSQIFLPLHDAQALSLMGGKISIVQLNVPGTPKQVDAYIAVLRQQIPDAQVRPIRQFTEGEAKIYDRISGLLTATVVIVLLLTGLCVMAAMTNVAMERKNDVGLMKAIGGATRRVLRLFMMEAALLGLAGGVIGAAAGIFLSIWLGKQVFGVAAQPRLIVYPVSVALTTIVAILSAYPLRRLASVRPASVFRGEA